MTILQFIYILGATVLIYKLSNQKITMWKTGLLQIVSGLLWPFTYGAMLVLSAILVAMTFEEIEDDFFEPFRIAYMMYSMLPYAITGDPAIQEFYS